MDYKELVLFIGFILYLLFAFSFLTFNLETFNPLKINHQQTTTNTKSQSFSNFIHPMPLILGVSFFYSTQICLSFSLSLSFCCTRYFYTLHPLLYVFTSFIVWLISLCTNILPHDTLPGCSHRHIHKSCILRFACILHYFFKKKI